MWLPSARKTCACVAHASHPLTHRHAERLIFPGTLAMRSAQPSRPNDQGISVTLQANPTVRPPQTFRPPDQDRLAPKPTRTLWGATSDRVKLAEFTPRYLADLHESWFLPSSCLGYQRSMAISYLGKSGDVSRATGSLRVNWSQGARLETAFKESSSGPTL